MDTCRSLSRHSPSTAFAAAVAASVARGGEADVDESTGKEPRRARPGESKTDKARHK